MKTILTRSAALSLALTAALGLSGCSAFFDGFQAKSPSPEPSADSTAATSDKKPSESPSASETPAPPESNPALFADAKVVVTPVKLDSFGLPLSIELGEGAELSQGVVHPDGVEIGGMSSAVQAWVFKADPKVKTVKAAKARTKVSGCDSTKVVKEGPDFYVYACKMRSMETYDFLMLREIKGVTYACESSANAIEDLDVRLAACRSLKAT